MLFRSKAAELSSVDSEIKSTVDQLENLRNQANGMKGLDCHEDNSQTVSKGCRLLVNAVAAEEHIPSVEQEIKLLQASLESLTDIRKQMSETKQKGVVLAELVARKELELAEVRKVSQLLFELDNATARLADLEAQEAAVRTRLEQRKADIARKLQEVTSRSQERQSELSAQKEEKEGRLITTRQQMIRIEQEIASLSAQINQMNMEQAEVRKVAQLVFELDNASARLAELDAQENTICVRLVQRAADISRKIQDIANRSQERQDELAKLKEETTARHNSSRQQLVRKTVALTMEITTLTQEIKELEVTLNGDMDKEIALLNESIELQGNAISRADADLKSLHARMGNIQGQLAALSKQRRELAFLDGEIALINDEITNWKILAKGCSNDGIIALELDDAGPSISSDTNKLLACYGQRYSVRFETQGATSKGNLREIFDILVFDGDQDEQKSIRDMSGGEETYIEDAITRSFCLHNLNRTSRSNDTLFSDEKDGALDFERKSDFLEIKRQAMRIGTHTREIFITQTPELYNMADARIELKPGSVQIVTR